MNPYIRRQLTLALEYFDANRLHAAADCCQRALDGFAHEDARDVVITNGDLEQIFGQEGGAK